MVDHVFRAFLERQRRDAEDLTRGSDVVAIHPGPTLEGPPQRYIVDLRSRTVVYRAGRALVADSGCAFRLWFPSDYLRHVDPWMILACIAPMDLFHPNIHPPAVCIGHIDPGTPMLDLVCRLFDLVTWRRWAAHDALDIGAAQWARQQERSALFPTDRRPLRRRSLVLNCESEAPRRGGASDVG